MGRYPTESCDSPANLVNFDGNNEVYLLDYSK